MEELLTEPTERLRDVYEDLEEEHKQILGMVSRARETTASAELLPMLRELHAVLTQHFAKETYPGGFYETVGACTAEYRDDLRVLVDEHFRIHARLWSLIESIRLAGKSAQDTSEAVAAVADMLEAHERKEHQLAEHLLG
jgi:hemerythrin